MTPTAAYPYNRRHAGSSTLHSDVDDMLRWAEANLQRGELAALVAGEKYHGGVAHGVSWRRTLVSLQHMLDRAGVVLMRV
jgi:hypothetical protein